MWPHRQRSVSPRKIEGVLDVINKEPMMSTKSLPEIRTSYTPLERALLSAYLGYPDPAPNELEGIDISETVDPDEWDESVQGIAPLPNIHGIDNLTLENAV